MRAPGAITHGCILVIRGLCLQGMDDEMDKKFAQDADTAMVRAKELVKRAGDMLNILQPQEPSDGSAGAMGK